MVSMIPYCGIYSGQCAIGTCAYLLCAWEARRVLAHLSTQRRVCLVHFRFKIRSEVRDGSSCRTVAYIAADRTTLHTSIQNHKWLILILCVLPRACAYAHTVWKPETRLSVFRRKVSWIMRRHISRGEGAPWLEGDGKWHTGCSVPWAHIRIYSVSGRRKCSSAVCYMCALQCHEKEMRCHDEFRIYFVTGLVAF